MKRLLNQFLSTVQLALRRIWTALGVLVANETIYALLLYARRSTSGGVTVGGVELLDLTPDGLMRYRRDVVGFVWQQNARNLLPYLTALQNIQLPLQLRGVGPRAPASCWMRWGWPTAWITAPTPYPAASSSASPSPSSPAIPPSPSRPPLCQKGAGWHPPYGRTRGSDSCASTDGTGTSMECLSPRCLARLKPSTNTVPPTTWPFCQGNVRPGRRQASDDQQTASSTL